jgi:basic membrane protein A and related proteins
MPPKTTRRRFMGLTAATLASAGGIEAMVSRAARANAPIPIGVIIPGSITDRGWMESGYNGMRAAQSELADKIKITSIENVSMADMEQALTTLAAANPLVVGAGGQCESAGYAVAKRFPNVKFSIIGGGGQAPIPNYVVTDGRQAQIAYVAGVAAAMLSKSGVISFVGGIELPPIVNASIEFGNGAKSVNPNIKYLPTLTGDFDDVAKAKEATLAAIREGADIHYHIMNLGLRGLEQAAREKGTHILGSYFDRCGSDPIYIGFTITGTGYMVKDQIKRFLGGTWTPGFLPYGLEAGPAASDIVLCQAAPEITAKLDQVRKDIVSGKIKTLPS